MRLKLEAVVVFGGVLASFALAIPPSPCVPPNLCPEGVWSQNGQGCGPTSVIETVNTNQNVNLKYCTKRNPEFHGCPVPVGQCNEEEWWYYTKAEIRCVNQTTGAYTVVGTCAWAVLSRTKSGHMCPACLEPVE